MASMTYSEYVIAKCLKQEASLPFIPDDRVVRRMVSVGWVEYIYNDNSDEWIKITPSGLEACKEHELKIARVYQMQNLIERILRI